MKVRSESDDDLPLDKTFSILGVIMVIRSVFPEDKKYYPQAYLHKCSYKFVN